MLIIYKKILLAIDGTFHSNNAAEHLVEFQENWNSEVIIFHSIEDSRFPSELYPNITPLYSIYSNFKEVCIEGGTQLLDKTKKMFNDNQLTVETRLIENEVPEDYILRIVEEEIFDLVVLGSKGKHPKLKKILLGTVSKKIVKSAPCDVLIVK